MRILKGDICAASGEFRASGLECGRLLSTKVTDARNNETEYVYNAFGEAIEEVSPTVAQQSMNTTLRGIGFCAPTALGSRQPTPTTSSTA